MLVRTRCFAVLRDVAPGRAEVELPGGATLEDAWRALIPAHPGLEPYRAVVRVARNGAYAEWGTPLADGDEVAFLPPVSGGAPRVETALSVGPIDVEALEARIAGDGDGAVVVFVGRARNRSDDGRMVVELEYEVYPEMAETVLAEIAREAAAACGAAVGVIHRHGVVPLGEAAVVIVSAAGHREAAYQANRRVIEAIKERLPIWKRERFADGSEWKRPGA
jgi:molybdopterin synthase catalytic subunit/molybdopterin converting factor small subunit